jgi:tetrahydromethanopterin S-methyltransferase subunit A
MQVDKSQLPRSVAWPPVAGSYIVGDPAAPVAICTLTSAQLLQPLASVPGVAIVGQLHTANVGIEHVVRNVIANPAIRYLLLCGKESRVFQPGQALRSLLAYGIDQAGIIVNAQGYEPVLRHLPLWQADLFRRQIELVDRTEEQDLMALVMQVKDLVEQSPGPFQEEPQSVFPVARVDLEPERFVEIRPGGRREPLSYDSKGYFVVSIDRAEGLIIVHHYLPDHTPAHVMRGRTAESVLLGLLREDLLSQLSHAGYLGAELAKAESALHLGITVHYEQDRPLRRDAMPMPRNPEEQKSTGGGPAASQTWAQFAPLKAPAPVDVALEVTALPVDQGLEGIFLEPGPDDPVRTFRRTLHPVRVAWSSATQVVMGKPEHFVAGALLRAIGKLRPSGEIEAEQIAVMSKVVSLLPDAD